MKFKKIILLLSLAFILFVPIISSAEIVGPDIISKTECTQGNPCTLNAFAYLAKNIATYILSIVGALALLMFVFGGLMWILSGGSSDKVQKGKDILVGSVVGLVIVFTSYLIIQEATKALSTKPEYSDIAAPPDPIFDDICVTKDHKTASCVTADTCKPGKAISTKCFTNDTGVCCDEVDIISCSPSTKAECVDEGSCKPAPLDDGTCPPQEECCAK